MFTQDELQNIFVLLQRANITGKEALPIAMLQQKVSGLLDPKKPEEKKEAKK